MQMSRRPLLGRANSGFVFLGLTLLGIFLYTSGVFGTGGLGSDGRLQHQGQRQPQCGELIYHVPGGHWYDRTRISTSKGERWFCSAREAEAVGWRRSQR